MEMGAKGWSCGAKCSGDMVLIGRALVLSGEDMYGAKWWRCGAKGGAVVLKLWR